MQIKSFELTKFQPSFICSEQRGKQQEKRIDSRENKVQLKLVNWSKKNANYRSHLRKIDENIRQKLERHTSHPLKGLPAKSSLLSQSFAHKINDKIH